MKKFILLSVLLLIVIGSPILWASITVGLIKHDFGSLDDGYVLFSPTYSTTTYLIDKCGYVVNKWDCKYRPGFSAYLLPDGNLLRTGYLANAIFDAGGSGGIIEKLDWDGKVLWSYIISDSTQCMHHDIAPLKNGNILAICWDYKNEIESTDMGRKPALLENYIWSEKIIELRPIGTDSAEIVWEWKVWDHLIQNAFPTKPNYAEISQHPELININQVNFVSLRDWLHFNSIDYNEELDQIMLSVPNFGEIWIIDHSTSKEESAGHSGGKYGKGGDLLYRWGNSITYGKGEATDQELFFQHSAKWIPKGFPNENCISVFNNARINNGNRFTSVDIVKPPLNSDGFYDSKLPYSPDKPKWSYSAENPQDFFSSVLGSAQQLSNGNMLICNGGSGIFFEIDSLKNEVWKYINPISVLGITNQGQSTKGMNQLFRCVFYPNTYSAFNGKDLTRKGFVENNNSLSENCSLDTTSVEDPVYNISIYPNPAMDYVKVVSELYPSKLSILNLQGQELIIQSNSNTISTKDLQNGIYILRLTDTSGISYYNKILITR
ncbi:MAG: aryl-sulfate sulfotransferase [bacterium]